MLRDFVRKGAVTPCDVVDMFLKFVNKLQLPNLATSDHSFRKQKRPRTQTLILLSPCSWVMAHS